MDAKLRKQIEEALAKRDLRYYGMRETAFDNRDALVLAEQAEKMPISQIEVLANLYRSGLDYWSDMEAREVLAKINRCPLAPKNRKAE